MSVSRLRAIIWSLDSANRISTISGLYECQKAKSHNMVFGKCQQDISHIWTFMSASKLRATIWSLENASRISHIWTL